MQRHGVTRGTKQQILAELDSLGDGMCRSGQECAGGEREAKVRRIARAWHAIDSGAEQVQVGHAVYVVVEG